MNVYTHTCIHNPMYVRAAYEPVSNNLECSVYGYETEAKEIFLKRLSLMITQYSCYAYYT